MINEDSLVNGSISLLVSMLLRYPELSSLNYDSKTKSLHLTYLTSSQLSEEQIHHLKEVLVENLDAYMNLTGNGMDTFTIEVTLAGNVSFIEITRDVKTLSKGEISLLTGLLHRELETTLISDNNEDLLTEELTLQEEIIEELLEFLRDVPHNQNVIAFRDNGKVLAFNK